MSLRRISMLLIAAGTGMLLFTAYLLWNPFAAQQRHALGQQLQRELNSHPGTGSPGRGGACTVRAPRTGQPFAFVRIPRFGRHWRLPVIQGTGEAQLDTGAVGHVAGTALPGQSPGNVALAAHVVSAGNPFLHLSDLRRGDRVSITDRCRTYTYRVTGGSVVAEHDVSVLYPVPGKQVITLITCYPAVYWSTPWRTVVRGTLLVRRGR